MVTTEFTSSNLGSWRGMKTFSYHVLTGRWFMLFASLLIMAVAGATYMFGLYSNEVKTSLGYDQTTLNLLSFFKDLGANVGVISGLINEVTPPWVVLLIGVIMNFFGYFMIWLSVTGHIPKPQVWQMCLYICIGANSQTFAKTGALVTCVKNFQLYHALYGDNTQALILLIAWLPAAVSCFFLPTIRILKLNTVQQPKESKVFYNLLYISLGLAGFLMVLIIIQNKLSFSRIEYVADGLGVIFLLLLPLAVVFREEFNLLKAKSQTLTDPSQLKVVTEVPPQNIALPEQESQVVEPPATTNLNKKSSCLAMLKPPNRGEDYTILQALFSIDMLILFIATTFGVGGTLTAIDNLGQIGHSLGYPTLGVPNSLYFASVIIGFCFGAQWPLMFAIISEIFGLKYYSTLYNFGAVASPVGSYILNVRVTGYLYDKEALKQLEAKGLTRQEGKDLTCVGVECYKMAFFIITASTLIGCFVSFILVLRTRKFYKGDIYRKFREEVEAAETHMETAKTSTVVSETEGNVTLSTTGATPATTSGLQESETNNRK
ncbi:Nodulin-like [Sesbania bispinosa]|nr:Nodulin-like [Sesbania bispinosa]